MAKLIEYLEAIKQIVLGNQVEEGIAPLGKVERTLSFKLALKFHSKYKPQVIVEKIDGTDVFDYKLSTSLTNWKDDFSVVRQVEYPVDDDDQSADILDEHSWEVYQKPDGHYLRFLENTPDASEDIRVTYTTFHTCTMTGDCTVKQFNEEAVQILGASFFCEMLGTYHAQAGDSTIDADSVNHKSKSSEYTARAKTLRELYFKFFNIVEGKTRAASLHMEWDKNASWGSQHLTHNPKYR